MTPKSKLTASIDAKPPKEFPEIVAMPVETLVEKIRASINALYREGLYSVNIAYMARAAVLLTEYANAESALPDAVRALYYAAVWHADRPVDASGLWTAVRDAAGFEPGQSPAPADVEVFLVPKKHAEAIKATLGYLVQAG